MALLTLLILVTLLTTVMLSARRQEEHLLTWQRVLSPRASEELIAEERSVERQVDTIEGTYELAARRRSMGELDEAYRLLEIGCASVAAFVPGRLARLRQMIRLSRAVAAMRPACPLRPSAFKLRRVALLVALSRAAHEILVTTGCRFRLRLRCIARAFHVVALAVHRDTHRVRTDATRWQGLSSGRADLRTLNAETLDSYRILLLALDHDERWSSIDRPLA